MSLALPSRKSDGPSSTWYSISSNLDEDTAQLTPEKKDGGYHTDTEAETSVDEEVSDLWHQLRCDFCLAASGTAWSSGG